MEVCIKHLVSLANLSDQTILSLIQRAHYFYSQRHNRADYHSRLKNKVAMNLFLEPSTRTRCSFEMASKLLGMDVINFNPENSSLKKGETLYDTLRTIESLGVDTIILRHSDDQVFEQLAPKIKCSMINAGAGKNEHPTQGLLDLFTLFQEFKTLSGLKLAICGDIKHSRVAGSMMVAAEKFGIELFFCGPEELMPDVTKVPRSVKFANFDDVIPKVDAVMMLRIQLERHENFGLSAADYFKKFGMTEERAAKMKAKSIIMHPGPFNRNIEIADSVVESSRSRIFSQVENGVYMRMSILDWLLSPKEQ